MIRPTCTTPPTGFPVTLAEAKKHCEIPILETRHDEHLERDIATATAEAEKITRRRFLTQTWCQYLEEWPSDTRIYIKFGQLQTVASVTYRDKDEQELTFSADDYIVNTEADPGYIVLGYSKSWPSDTLSPSTPIKIEFTCGWTSAANVPEAIKQAILTRVADMFENRENKVIGGGITVTTDLKIFENLAMMYRINVI